MVPPARHYKPDDLKFLFRGENSGAWPGKISKLENGLPDYNPQQGMPCEGFFMRIAIPFLQPSQGFCNKKLVRLMIIFNSGYNGQCDEI
jgi:hypothetical protein